MSSFITLVYESINNFEKDAARLTEIASHKIEYFNPKMFDDVDSHFISDNIMADIKDNMKYVYTIDYKFQGRKIHMVVILRKRDAGKVRFLFTMVNLFQYILNRLGACDKDLNLYLIESNKKKVKPEDGGDLSSDNVNTGVTFVYFYQNYRDMYIFRHEEMLKVLLHELVHFYDLDQKNVHRDIENDLNGIFNLRGKSINVNESFTDSYACLLNILIYCALRTRLESQSYKWYVAECNKVFKRERKYILEQSINVLKHNGYEIIDGKIMPTRAISESTSVTSYYILKAVIFCNINMFLKYLDEHHFKLQNVFKYVEIIKTLIPIYTENARKSFNKVSRQSLRMTIIDNCIFQKAKVYKEKSIGYIIKKWPLKKLLLPKK